MKPYIDIHTHKRLSPSCHCLALHSWDGREPLSLEKINYYFSFGVHPWFSNIANVDRQVKSLDSLIQHPYFLAFGEMGLDRACPVELSLQYKILEQQLSSVRAFANIPLVIHAVRTHADLMEVFKKWKIKNPLIFHDYNASEQQTEAWLKNFKCYFSYGSNLFRPESRAMKQFCKIPVDCLFLETDDLNIPIESIYEKASVHRKISLSILKEKIFLNFLKLFPRLEGLYP